MSELIDTLSKRREGLAEFLSETSCGIDQRHLEIGTPERDYWHYGYAMALQDVLAMMGEGQPQQ